MSRRAFLRFTVRPRLPGGQGSDHPGPDGRVSPGDLEDHLIVREGRPPGATGWLLGPPVESLATHAGDARHGGGRASERHQLAQNARRAVSLPSPQEFPPDLKLHRLAPQGALEAGVALRQLVELGALGLAGKLLRAGSQELLSPPREQRLRDVALPRELGDRLVALQRSEHEPGLLPPRRDSSQPISSPAYRCAGRLRALASWP